MIPKKMYFLGELGVFVQFALGLFERCFDAHPDAKIDLLTYPDFGRLAAHLFPRNITATDYTGPNLGHHRFGVGLVAGYPAEVDALVAGRVDITPLAARFGMRQPLYFGKQQVPNDGPLQSVVRRGRAVIYRRLLHRSGPYFPILPLKAPILGAACPDDDAGSIVLLPRLRSVAGGTARNIDSDFWHSLICDHLAPRFQGRLPIYLGGLPAERVADLPADVRPMPPGGLMAEARILKQCALLICPLSGYGQFGSYVGANTLYVLPQTPVAEQDRHIKTLDQSNIFDREVTFVQQDALLAQPKIAIDRIEQALANPQASAIAKGATS